jgi:hypothetical protein
MTPPSPPDDPRWTNPGGAVSAAAPQEDEEPPTPSATRSTLTILTDASKTPRLGVKAAVRRREIVNEIGGAYILHPSLLERSLIQSQIDATAFSPLADSVLHSGCRWIGIREDYRLEKDLAADFIELLAQLLKLWRKQPGRSVNIHNLIDTQGIFVPDDRDPNHTLRPDIFIQGTGPLFPPRPGTGHKPNWSSCVAIADAKLNLARNKTDTFSQLGTYAEQVFSAQENRRFVYTFYFDNFRLVWCTFDRGGAVHGDAVNYHSDPWKLCALVLHFLFHGTDLGMDTSIRYDRGLTMISTTPPPERSAPCEEIPDTTYVVRRTLFHSTDIRGHGSIYWLAQGGEFDDPTRNERVGVSLKMPGLSMVASKNRRFMTRSTGH